MVLMRSMVERMKGDGVGRDRHAVAEFAHQVFGGMRQRLEPRERERTGRCP